jgi:NAD(P)-dependent dehydrogenase (short-subunit alcohol dehydrogenase family)
MGKLEGEIALITGGNTGIGLAAAKQIVNEGSYVFITGCRDRLESRISRSDSASDKCAGSNLLAKCNDSDLYRESAESLASRTPPAAVIQPPARTKSFIPGLA